MVRNFCAVPGGRAIRLIADNIEFVEEQFSPDTTLKGRYKIEKELGRGGMGVVYLASDLELLSRPVVVKVLYEENYHDVLIKRKFRQEMEALSRMDHPGVVAVLDAGELDDGKPFIVMQFIEGVDLRSALNPQGMEFRRIARILQQSGAALNLAHEKGIYHRDLKPENIMIQHPGGENEQVKLIDFGLAKVTNSKIAESTQMGNVMGSFGYMSPEQLIARDVTAASDVYSLGVIAYEMLTGRRPFNPDSVFQLYDMQKSGVPQKPSSLRPDLSDTAQRILLKALSFEPANRYGNAREFCNELSQAILTPAKTPSSDSKRETSVLTDFKSIRPRPLLLMWLSALILLPLFALFLKYSFYRFLDWQSFFVHPIVASFLLGLCILMGVAGSYDKTRKRHLILNCIGIALLSFELASTPEVITFSTGSSAKEGYTLNYSDPKGYLYTVVDSSYCLISIDPGRWNRLTDYTLQLTLSPYIQFADVYFDQDFHLTEQLSLQPSNTNDILLLQRKGDDFLEARQIRFTYKYRTYHADNQILVTLKSGSEIISSEKAIVPPRL